MLSLAAATSCRIFRRSKATPPPPPLVVVTPPPAKPAEPTVPPPQEQIPARQEGPPPQIQPLPPSIEVPPPKSPRATRRRPQAPAPAEPEEAAPAPAPIPQLQQILTPEQRQALNQSVDQSMARARQSLNALAGRRLNDEQNAVVERIHTFIRQAEESRGNDLVRAKNLAERAEVLAADLLSSLR